LHALDTYVAELSTRSRSASARSQLRQQVYEAARSTFARDALYECDSPVGSGKTTAVMAHLLRVAVARRLRHIFVVLPYTNVIDQTVEVYRQALVLAGEKPERVVAAHHHQADFENEDARHLATLWDCPIMVTTAVQFFETLAGNRPGKIRKLHEVAGSAIFIDEAHAAMPTWLWPVTWKWITELSSQWGCHFVLASGTLARFWQQPQFCSPPVFLPNLLPDELRVRLSASEVSRVRYERVQNAMTVEALVDFARKLPGPRVIVLNTVKSAAVVACAYRCAGGDVLHVSTALAPRDRQRVIAVVRARLKDGADHNWTLIATSCVEAGVDFDFRSAVRELSTACSMVQLGGRANRHGNPDWGAATVWTVSLADSRITANPSLTTGRRVLERLFASGAVGRLDASELCSSALRLELSEADVTAGAERLKKADIALKFREMADLYRLIDEDTVLAVVDDEIADRVSRGQPVDPYDLAAASVHVARNKVADYNLAPLKDDELYRWALAHDGSFLGYMEGVIKRAES
jgi:CRISPR-associated endonuclease/helicase Cas3